MMLLLLLCTFIAVQSLRLPLHRSSSTLRISALKTGDNLEPQTAKERLINTFKSSVTVAASLASSVMLTSTIALAAGKSSLHMLLLAYSNCPVACRKMLLLSHPIRPYDLISKQKMMMWKL